MDPTIFEVQELPSLKLTARTSKWMVGILVSFWDGAYFMGYVSFRECIPTLHVWNIYQHLP